MKAPRRGADAPRAPAGFVVWIRRDDAGELAGVVERVRTGDKRRFARLADLPGLIARMLGSVSTSKKPTS